MQTGYSGCLRHGLVASSTGKSATSGVAALARHQFGPSQALHKRLQPHGVRTGKQRASRLNVSALTDGPLPVVLDRDFDKEGSRIYKRTVLCCSALSDPLTAFSISLKSRLTCRCSISAIGLRIEAQGATAGIYSPSLGYECLFQSFQLYMHLYEAACDGLHCLYQYISCNAMQSRIFRGLLGPLLSVTALATCVATYETLREVEIYVSLTWQLPAGSCMHACMLSQAKCSMIKSCASCCIQLWVRTLSRILSFICLAEHNIVSTFSGLVTC